MEADTHMLKVPVVQPVTDKYEHLLIKKEKQYESPTPWEVSPLQEFAQQVGILRVPKVSNNQFMGDVIGLVAQLGTVGTGDLSRVLAEYLGHDQMLAIVCRSFEAAGAREDLKLSFAEKFEKILVASDLADAECAAKLDPRDGKDPIYDPDKPLPEGFAWVSLFLGGTGKTYVNKIFCFHCGGKHMSDQCSIKGTPQAIEFQKSNDLLVSVDTLVIPK